MIPFVVAMVGDHPLVPIASVSLGFVLLMSSVATYLLLRYSYVQSKLAEETLSFDSIKDVLRKNMAAILLTLVGIITAFKFVYISYIIYFVVLAIFMVPHKLEKIIRFSRHAPDAPIK